jgi:hypothetical protein
MVDLPSLLFLLLCAVVVIVFSVGVLYELVRNRGPAAKRTALIFGLIAIPLILVVGFILIRNGANN